jgi:hypothetical protein
METQVSKAIPESKKAEKPEGSCSRRSDRKRRATLYSVRHSVREGCPKGKPKGQQEGEAINS